jgi:hypothetical protein
VKAILVAVAAVGTILVAVGCPCVGCDICRQSGPGFCGGDEASSYSCGECPTLCPGFCLSDGASGGGPLLAVPCPGFCANDAGTLAISCAAKVDVGGSIPPTRSRNCGVHRENLRRGPGFLLLQG